MQLASRDICVAILAAIAEKCFDRVESTRTRAKARLREHRYPLARPFAAAGKQGFSAAVSC